METSHALSVDDGRALDAFFDAVVISAPDDRSARVRALLSLLDGMRFSDADRESLVEATIARVMLESRRAGQSQGSELVLVPDDEDALEALVSAGFQLSRVPAGMRERAARHAALFNLLGGPIDSDPLDSHLVERTLSMVQTSIDVQHDRLSLPRRGADERERGRVFAFLRSRELVSVAALIVIAGALLTPLAQYMREYSRRTACARNMNVAGIAFSQYAAGNQDRLPMASACEPGNLFWNVGKQRDQSNSANLFLLHVLDFATPEQLSCGGQGCAPMSHDAWDWPNLNQVSLSFQSMFAAERPRWSSTSHVVLTDASPVIRRAVRHQVIYPFENSANHARQGQNVLWTDGHVDWLTSPVLSNNDNIWLPRPIENAIAKMTHPHEADPLHGTETPSSADDAFVGP